ncbi:uncharacterized protein [Lolium perenne]|uniref:uncharacterized protein n=1 Tax=Lolium perenne TaxID=4522 RepID=UPI003A99E59D
MAIEVSSYEELLTNSYPPNQVLQAFPELPLGALIVAYLWGIRADNIEYYVPNNQLDKDHLVPLPLDVHNSIPEALIDQMSTPFLFEVVPVYHNLKSGPYVPAT